MIMSKKQKKEEEIPWSESDAKMIHEQDLASGVIPLDSKEMEPRIVYQQWPEFAEYPYKHFCNCLNYLQKKTGVGENHASVDSDALAHDWKIHPKKPKNHRNEPRWEGSKAKWCLKCDIDEGKHNSLEPKDLYGTRKEYQNYPRDVFWKHIHQEVKCHKYIAQCKSRVEKKKKRKP